MRNVMHYLYDVDEGMDGWCVGGNLIYYGIDHYLYALFSN